MQLQTTVSNDSCELPAFQQHILSWYATFRRDLPWRDVPNPYHILVSEVMLQQTGVRRVIPIYNRFLESFPTLPDLASAPVAEVLRAWQGMGYNRRALNLRRSAEMVCRDYGGRLPETVQSLEGLPGIGKYTARAVACFAFGAQVPVVDTNVRRVLCGFAGRELNERETWILAEKLLPPGRASEWNQALMDYGALVQRPKRKASPVRAEPFASSNRFWRGRIVDILREHQTLSLPALLDALPYPNREEERVRGLVHILHEEGMVDYNAGEDSVSLPA